MLTRLRFRRDYRVIIKYFSDKPTDDGKGPDINAKNPKPSKKDAATEKIQELLKSMMAEPKIDEREYREKFATAPERTPLKKDEIEVTTEKIEDSITKAAGDVAQAIGGNVKQTEAELLSKILGKINQNSTSLSDLLIGMKVDRSKDSDDVQKQTRGQQVKKLVSKAKSEIQSTRFGQRKSSKPAVTRPVEQDRKKSAVPQAMSVNIFSGTPLGIFKANEHNYGTTLEMWENLKQRELTLATTQPPANYFEKMILWTEQGKVWKFPIDNEQGFEEEKNVQFSEHIFLDAHLEDWCPKRGPIRHFMELVCVGLSKNPFYTVQEKRDHITWYKEYFESKKDLLTEVGAWDVKQGETSAEN